MYVPHGVCIFFCAIQKENSLINDVKKEACLCWIDEITTSSCFAPTGQKIKSSIKDLSSKCDKIHSFLRIWSHLLEKSWMENFIFCAVFVFVLLQSTEWHNVSLTCCLKLLNGPLFHKFYRWQGLYGLLMWFTIAGNWWQEQQVCLKYSYKRSSSHQI